MAWILSILDRLGFCAPRPSPQPYRTLAEWPEALDLYRHARRPGGGYDCRPVCACEDIRAGLNAAHRQGPGRYALYQRDLSDNQDVVRRVRLVFVPQRGAARKALA